MLVYVTKDSETIDVKTEVYRRSGGNPERTQTETLKVGSNGENVHLASREALYVIPEQASQYILTRLLEFIRQNS